MGLGADTREHLGVEKIVHGRSASTRPPSRQSTRVAMRLTCPRLWLAHTRVSACAPPANSVIRASTSRLACGSRLAVGSSSSSTSGRRAQARASARRCCCPPESWRPPCWATACRPTRSSASWACARACAHDSPCVRSSHRPRATLFSAEVRSRCGRWNSIAWRRAGSRQSSPETGGNKPCSVRSKVLLPEPLGPISATRSPGAIDRLTSCKARTAPNRTDTCRNCTSGVITAPPPGGQRLRPRLLRRDGATRPPAH